MGGKDHEKAQRLNEVYKFLFAHDKVKSQTDFADKLKVQRTGLSAAMNGSKANLTKNLFMKICATFPGIFNIDYLLNGFGTLTNEDRVVNEETGKAAHTSNDDVTANILELYAQRVRLVDDLRSTLKAELEEIRSIKSELHQERENLRDATYRLVMAIERINNNRGNISSIGIAADDGNV